MATWSYQVKYRWDDSAGTNYDVDITSYVIAIDDFTDVGSGEIPTATLTLNARDGNFITNSTVTQPIDEFDKIEIILTDSGGDKYQRVMEVATLRRIKTVSDGVRLVIELIGQERHLMNVHFAKQFYFDNAWDVVKGIIDQYGDNRGSRQPMILNYDQWATGGSNYNNLPKWTSNNYDFGVSEEYCYDGIRQVVDKLGTTVAAGGAQNFYEFKFKDYKTPGGEQNSDLQKILFYAFESGNNANQASEPTIQNAVTNPVYNIKGLNESKTGTVIVGKGAQGYGSLPKDNTKWWSLYEQFLAIPEWKSLSTEGGYPQNAYVKVTASNGTKTYYQSNQNSNTSTPPSNWTQKYARDIIGDSLNYAKWNGDRTTSGYKIVQNAMAYPNSTSSSNDNFTKPAMWDSNLCVQDETYFRTWVDAIVTGSSSNIPANLLYSGNPYRGLRVLVNGTGTGNFSNFEDMVIQYDGTQWFIFKDHSTNMSVANMADGRCYIYDGSQSLGSRWAAATGAVPVTGTTTIAKNDCFHFSKTVTYDEGIAEVARSSGTYGSNMAFEVEYSWSPLGDALVLYDTQNYYGIGAWLNIKFPIPCNSYNSKTIGSLYGGDSNSNYEPATLDVNNMHMTPSGKTGFNQTDSEELGTLEALEFSIKLRWLTYGTPALEGDFKMRCAIYDTSDNVVVQDFTISHNDNFETITLPISSFKLYRARVPWGWGDVASNLIVPDLEILNIFEWKNIKMICIQTQDSYDDEGRYRPQFNRFGVGRITAAESIQLYLDNLHFTKQVTAISGQDTTRNIEPDFLQRPFSTNYAQLKADVESQKLVEEFRYNSYDIETEGKCDPNLTFGDSFFLEDDKVVYLASPGTGETTNKIKLVAKKISYSVNGTTGGAGGFTRKILGVKRLS